jgi:hypothetical protein
MKTIAGKQVRRERRAKSLDDDSGKPLCQSLGRCLQCGASPTENRAQGPWQARKQGQRSNARNHNRRVADARSRGRDQGGKSAGEGRRRTISDNVVDAEGDNDEVCRL